MSTLTIWSLNVLVSFHWSLVASQSCFSKGNSYFSSLLKWLLACSKTLEVKLFSLRIFHRFIHHFMSKHSKDCLSNREVGKGGLYTHRGLPPEPVSAFILFVCLFCFPDRVSLCNSPGCPGTSSVDQAGLELTEICLPLPPECWN